MTIEEPYFVAFKDIDHPVPAIIVTKDVALFERLDDAWGGNCVEEEKDLKNFPMKVLVTMLKLATGQAPKKFENLADGAKRVWPHMGKLVSETAVKTKIAKAKVPKKVKEPAAPRGLKLMKDKTIKLMVEGNPKRAGSKAFAYFEALRRYDGKTVDEFLTNGRNEPEFQKNPNDVYQELRWCALVKGYVSLV